MLAARRPSDEEQKLQARGPAQICLLAVGGGDQVNESRPAALLRVVRAVCPVYSAAEERYLPPSWHSSPVHYLSLLVEHDRRGRWAQVPCLLCAAAQRR